MKLAALLALLALAYGVDSAATFYDEFGVDAEELAGDEQHTETHPPEMEQYDMEEPSENTPIPMNQYVQEIEEHMREENSGPLPTEMEPNTADTAGS